MLRMDALNALTQWVGTPVGIVVSAAGALGTDDVSPDAALWNRYLDVVDSHTLGTDLLRWNKTQRDLSPVVGWTQWDLSPVADLNPAQWDLSPVADWAPSEKTQWDLSPVEGPTQWDESPVAQSQWNESPIA